MATSIEYRDFILEQLSLLFPIKCRAMMSEYLLYYDHIYFGGIYDNRFLIKNTKSNEKYRFKEELPYSGAKPMYLVDSLDNKEWLRDLVIATCKDLSTE